MSANVESMFAVKIPTWHGEENLLATAPKTSKEALIAAGMDWTVRAEPVEVAGKIVEGRVGIVRDTDDSCLGIVGDGYRVVQNAECAAFFDEALATGGLTYETAGSLNGGRTVWLMALLGETEVIEGDTLKTYVYISNGHDGSRSVRAATTDIRVVCANTLAMADRSGGVIFSARHIAGVKDALKVATENFTRVVEKRVETAEKYRALAKARISETALDGYLRAVFARAKKDPETGEKRPDVAEALVASAVAGFGTIAEREKLPAIEGTWWAALNAATEVLTHRGIASPGRRQTRAESIAFGETGATINRARALAFAAV